MRWGLSWGAQAPHHIEVMGIRYELRTTKIAGVWTAYATVRGVCVEATGTSEREARQKWQKTVEAMTPLLAIERRVERSLDDATSALDTAALGAAALDDATLQRVARDLAAERITAADSASTAAEIPPLHPETCEIRRSADRRLRPRLPREL